MFFDKYMIYHFVRKIRQIWYSFFYKIHLDNFEGTMFPQLGGGKYVSVLRKGSIIDIVDERKDRFVRIVPYQPNHGVMVELHENGKLINRYHLDIMHFAAWAGKNWSESETMNWFSPSVNERVHDDVSYN